MTPCRCMQGGSMLNLLIPYFGFSPWIIHRLDMRTSGDLLHVFTVTPCPDVSLEHSKVTPGESGVDMLTITTHGARKLAKHRRCEL